MNKSLVPSNEHVIILCGSHDSYWIIASRRFDD